MKIGFNYRSTGLFHKGSTLKCLSIGTPKIINFLFVSNGKLMIFRCPNIQAHYNEAVLCLDFGTPENNEFSILGQMENLLFLGVPVLKHIRILQLTWDFRTKITEKYLKFVFLVEIELKELEVCIMFFGIATVQFVLL